VLNGRFLLNYIAGNAFVKGLRLLPGLRNSSRRGGSTVSVSRTILAPKDARHRPIICSSVLHAHINNLVKYSESREKHHEFRIQLRDDAGGCSH
jgi:hypothetical protein